MRPRPRLNRERITATRGKVQRGPDRVDFPVAKAVIIPGLEAIGRVDSALDLARASAAVNPPQATRGGATVIRLRRHVNLSGEWHLPSRLQARGLPDAIARMTIVMTGTDAGEGALTAATRDVAWTTVAWTAVAVVQLYNIRNYIIFSPRLGC